MEVLYKAEVWIILALDIIMLVNGYYGNWRYRGDIRLLGFFLWSLLIGKQNSVIVVILILLDVALSRSIDISW